MNAGYCYFFFFFFFFQIHVIFLVRVCSFSGSLFVRILPVHIGVFLFWSFDHFMIGFMLNYLSIFEHSNLGLGRSEFYTGSSVWEVRANLDSIVSVKFLFGFDVKSTDTYLFAWRASCSNFPIICSVAKSKWGAPFRIKYFSVLPLVQSLRTKKGSDSLYLSGPPGWQKENKTNST